MSVEAYPLHWPDGWDRHRTHVASNYTMTPDAIRKHLLREIKLLGGGDVVISSNVRLRDDGQPYSKEMEKRHKDPGVAVYFNRTVWKDGHKRVTPHVFACDKYIRVDDNLHAIGLCIEGMRAMQRSGASDMLDRAFTGFKALPPPNPWFKVLGFKDGTAVTLEQIERAFKQALHRAHPDKGGSDAALAELNWARSEGTKQVKQRGGANA